VVKLYAPCGLIVPLRETTAVYKKLRPEVEIEQEYDNAITMARRIMDKGERPDLFISPGATEMDILEEQGLIDTANKRVIGKFQLVVYAPKASTVALEKPEDLLQVDTISCPDPEVNSVGAVAKEALTTLGLWDKVEPKVQQTEFPIESHKWVASGKTEAGLGYKHCPLDTAPEKLSKSKVRVALEFPADSYSGAECYIAPLVEAPHPEAAVAFIDYLTSADGQKTLADNQMPGAGTLVAAAGEAKVQIQAYYPDNEGHAAIKAAVLGLEKQYPGKVAVEFIDFTTEEGYERRKAAGLTCGGVVINGKQTWMIERDGREEPVTFMMGMGGEWQKEDLDQAVASEVASVYGGEGQEGGER
jgi:molybdate transport system substrate-binding protein